MVPRIPCCCMNQYLMNCDCTDVVAHKNKYEIYFQFSQTATVILPYSDDRQALFVHDKLVFLTRLNCSRGRHPF